MQIFAAVIEWRSGDDSREPGLILGTTWGEMADGVRAAVQEFAEELDDNDKPDLRHALVSLGPVGWDTWRAETPYIDGMPFISTYTKEVAT